MTGLVKTSAATTSLLLNLESVFTALIAWFAFKKHTDRKIILGMFLTVVGSFVLNLEGKFRISKFIGANLDCYGLSLLGNG